MTKTQKVTLRFRGGKLDGRSLSQRIPAHWVTVRYEHVARESRAKHCYSGIRRPGAKSVTLLYDGAVPVEATS